MSEMSDFLEDRLINVMFRTQVAWKPTDIYLLLATATILDADTGTVGITEPVGNAYARKDTGGPLDAEWDATSGSDGLTANTNVQTFATASGGNWGTITDMAICGAVTAGDVYFFTPLTTPKAINDGDTAEFAAGAITVTLA
jgi:hypothetical protein